MTKRKEKSTTINIKNRKAEYEYFLLTKYTAGIVLTGTEIKSIRAGKANLTDAYCLFIENELWIRGLHIAEYLQGSYNNHEPKRDRKLLLTKRELKKLQSKLKDNGTTIIPTLLFINENGLAKIDVYLARGKKMYDKRDAIKEKDIRRAKERNEE
ncbi:MAG TPA: SsrA-binding protein SmpB [Bacteroidales bacterium]|nr:SsrA-binding protein SmpB [Bacteroidales bacterium]HON21103.1 SsrA-binding protein SmpB [Bacteroidales bacterium]HOR82418.1 SsrA-binding protein SmpB [Bacteroidales bacterium]HPJ91662.1 SsrA-binding protein SmpB [Bacteroidales bacterium]HQB20507.1 SsrA-binding protein SmpB [Bacteroidales bacterium]